MLNYLKMNKGEIVIDIKHFNNSDAQFDCSCDCCGAPIEEGDMIIGKIISYRVHDGVGSRFSPTCLDCAPDWVKKAAVAKED